MPSLLNPCDPDRLRLLAEGRLSPAEMAGLEDHLARCGRCREGLDRLVDGDRWLGEVRHYLGSDATDAYDVDPAAGPEPLDFLAPTDWPDSLGRLGAYEVRGILGRGGMGVVLKAFDPALNRNVAIKVLSSSLATCGAARRRFLREARAAAAVVHEHVVGVFAVVESSGLPFLVMEYVPGRSLQDRIDKQGALSLEEVLRIGMQTASGLAAAHAQGLVHRDVKPANILLEDGVERVRLTDFGLARAAADAAMTRSGVVAGTPHYMAPEQARGETADPRSDLFSLGSTLYAACAGHPPFRAESALAVLRRVCDDEPRPLRELNPGVPSWLESIVARLMAKDPARRPQDANEVATLLAACLAHVQDPLAAPLPVGLTRPGPRARGRWLARAGILIAFAATSAAAAGALMFLSPGLGRGTAPRQAEPRRGSQEAGRRAASWLDERGADPLQSQIDQARQQARAIEADLVRWQDDTLRDPISALGAALGLRAEALERDIVGARPTPAGAAAPSLNPAPQERR